MAIVVPNPLENGYSIEQVQSWDSTKYADYVSDTLESAGLEFDIFHKIRIKDFSLDFGSSSDLIKSEIFGSSTSISGRAFKSALESSFKSNEELVNNSVIDSYKANHPELFNTTDAQTTDTSSQDTQTESSTEQAEIEKQQDAETTDTSSQDTPSQTDSSTETENSTNIDNSQTSISVPTDNEFSLGIDSIDTSVYFIGLAIIITALVSIWAIKRALGLFK